MKIFKIILILLALQVTAYSYIEFDSQNNKDYELKATVRTSGSSKISFYDRSKIEFINVPVNIDDNFVSLALKKEFNQFFYKVWEKGDKEPVKWTVLRSRYISKNKQGSKNNTRANGLLLKPLKTTSINTSWGKIKYLFTNN